MLFFLKNDSQFNELMAGGRARGRKVFLGCLPIKLHYMQACFHFYFYLLSQCAHCIVLVLFLFILRQCENEISSSNWRYLCHYEGFQSISCLRVEGFP